MIKYIGFTLGLPAHIQKLFEYYLNSNKNYLIIGPWITSEQMSSLKNDNFDVTLMTVFEPIFNSNIYDNIRFPRIREFVTNYKTYKNMYLFGCVENNPEEKKIKFPLYMMERFPIYKNPNMYFIKANNFIKNTDIFSKNFCCLINRWDPDNHRTKMHNILNKLDKIICPSTLLQNCSNHQLNIMGKTEYIKQFIFNICSENTDNTHEGYITEKLMDCCLGGAIPIYAGWFDEYDAKIFNKNRIIFYNSKDDLSFEKVYNQVKQLLEDKEKLIAFYRQPVFCDTANETIEKLKENFNTL
jgi:hypothetical protein